MQLATRLPTGWRSAFALGVTLVAVLSFAAAPALIPFALAFALTAATGFAAVPALRRLKAGQYIREDGPQSHLKKAGTPTMGGIFFLPWAVLVPVVLTGFAPDVLAAAGLTAASGLVGFLDDWQIIRYRNNKGIAPRTKLLLLLGTGVLFVVYCALSGHSTRVNGLGDWGLFYWALALFAIAGTTNGVNVTDGLDALAGGTSALAAVALGLIVLPTQPQLAVFAFALAGVCLGFLVHNRHKASVFMGDTGSLAIGGALAAVAILSGQMVALALAGGVFALEAISVMLQVGYFKATKGPDGKGKRLLRMAPLHHHFELGGWHETQVVSRFYLAGALLAGIAVWLAPYLR